MTFRLRSITSRWEGGDREIFSIDQLVAIQTPEDLLAIASKHEKTRLIIDFDENPPEVIIVDSYIELA